MEKLDQITNERTLLSSKKFQLKIPKVAKYDDLLIVPTKGMSNHNGGESTSNKSSNDSKRSYIPKQGSSRSLFSSGQLQKSFISKQPNSAALVKEGRQNKSLFKNRDVYLERERTKR